MEGRIAGGMAVYHDAATERRGDYAEIYNPTGGLLAVIWFDRFGILRSAVDRGIVLKQTQCGRSFGARSRGRSRMIPYIVSAQSWSAMRRIASCTSLSSAKVSISDHSTFGSLNGAARFDTTTHQRVV